LNDVKPQRNIPQDVSSYLISVQKTKVALNRRNLLRFALAGAGAAAASAVVPEPAATGPVDLKDKRKARYQPDSSEVRNFYRVNSYPAR
jgi:hypothetical protein